MVSKNKNCNWTQKKSACFKQGVPDVRANIRVWIHSETSTWHDKNIQLKAKGQINFKMFSICSSVLVFVGRLSN